MDELEIIEYGRLGVFLNTLDLDNESHFFHAVAPLFISLGKTPDSFDPEIMNGLGCFIARGMDGNLSNSLEVNTIDWPTEIHKHVGPPSGEPQPVIVEYQPFDDDNLQELAEYMQTHTNRPCLIGPYADLEDAETDLNKIKEIIDS